MKFIKSLLVSLSFAVLAAVSASPVEAQTFPVNNINIQGQLQLNGSPGTAGYVVQSNGTSPATWVPQGTVPTNGLTLPQINQIGANTVLGNATGSTANVTAVPVPGCSTASSAITYANATGWGCNTAINASTLGGATFAAPSSIGSTTPAPGSFTNLGATGTITAPFSSVQGLFNSICSSTIGQAWVRTTNGFGCTALGYANPVWWGADSTGTSSSTSAFNSAAAASGIVWFPQGTFLFSTAPNVISTGGESINGSGQGTILEIGYATGDFIHLTGQYSSVNNAYISETVTRTSGADVDADAASITLSNLTTYGAYIGTLFTPNCNLCTGTNLVDANMTPQTTVSGAAGIVVGSTTGTAFPNQVMLTNVTVQGLSGSLPSYSMEVLSATGLQLTSFELEQAATAVLAFVPPTGNGVNYSFLTNGFLDRGLVGFYGRPSGGSGEIEGVWLSNVWAGDNTAANSLGIDLDNGGTGTVSGFYCTSCHVVNASGSSSYGMVVNNNSWKNISVVNSCFAGNTTAGVLDAAGVTYQTFIGNTFGNCDGWGVNGEDFGVSAGAGDYLTILGNTFNSTATLSGVGGLTGTHSKISQNIGYDPVGVTVTTPTSGTSYTNGPTPETCYISASTSVSSVFLPASGGTNILNAGTVGAGIPVTFDLGPNETYNMSFSGTGRLVCSVH
jgi:hypothetical protein